MRPAGFAALIFLSLGIAGYAIVVYGFVRAVARDRKQRRFAPSLRQVNRDLGRLAPNLADTLEPDEPGGMEDVGPRHSLTGRWLSRHFQGGTGFVSLHSPIFLALASCSADS